MARTLAEEDYWTLSMSRAAASTSSAVTRQEPLQQNCALASPERRSPAHARTNQKAWAKGVSARMTMRKIRKRPGAFRMRFSGGGSRI